MSCCIRIDPDELAAASASLTSVASELSALAAEVYSACCGCCVPPGFEGQIAGSAGAVRSTLIGVSEQLGVAARDLSSRAGIAASDLATATSSAWGGEAPAGGVQVGVASSASGPVVGEGSGTVAAAAYAPAGTVVGYGTLPQLPAATGFPPAGTVVGYGALGPGMNGMVPVTIGGGAPMAGSVLAGTVVGYGALGPGAAGMVPVTIGGGVPSETAVFTAMRDMGFLQPAPDLTHLVRGLPSGSATSLQYQSSQAVGAQAMNDSMANKILGQVLNGGGMRGFQGTLGTGFSPEPWWRPQPDGYRA